MKMRKRLIRLSFLLIFFSLIFFCMFFYIRSFYDIDILKNIEVSQSGDDSINVIINNANSITNCGYSTKNGDIRWTDVKANKCAFKVSSINSVYIKKYVFVRKQELNNIVLSDSLPSKVFLALNDSLKLNPKLKIIGDKKDIEYRAVNSGIVSVKNNKIIGKKVGTTRVKMIVNDSYTKEFEVEVTNLIVKRPKKFNKHKKNLKCNRYSLEESKQLDAILKSRIESVGGYGTRAAVVESIRFLMLDFPYQIEYFFENGRIDGGMHNADGEGRYYHKGLFLHKSKFKDLKYSYAGPAIWGCPLKNYEDYGTIFKKGQYKPNGLDCSGFVSWSILNGGFDVGDRGAGDNLEDTTEINDIGGEKVDTSVQLFKSGKVKAGDLLGVWGHIAIVAGIDNEHVYVAESLWTFGGPVINTYTFKEATDEFVQAVLLDDLYKADGLYTNMW